MQIIRSVKDLEAVLQQYEEINFVPTMGNLHAGHLSLVSEAKKYDGITLVSIFINPLQFAPNEDLDIYPRTEKQDLKDYMCYPLYESEPKCENCFKYGHYTDKCRGRSFCFYCQK